MEKETGNHFKHEQELKTFDDAAVLWMKSKKNRVKESTFAVYYLAVQSHLLPKLGHLKLDEITEEGKKAFIEKSQSCYDKFRELIGDDELFDATAKFTGRA